MSRFLSPLLFGTLGIILVLSAMPTHAEDAVPVPLNFDGQTASGTVSDDFAARALDPHLYDDLKNPWFRDILLLNHQNQLLSRVVSRQTSIAKLEQSFGKMGVPYQAPAPSHEICEQLPMNAACGRVYPDLYGGYVAKRQEEIRKMQEEIDRKAALRNAIAGTSPASSDTAAAVVEELPPTYYWQDIKCLNGQCRAVLVSANNASDVKTFRVGDRINKNTKIKTIAETGVTLAFKGKTVEVQPKPLGSGESPAALSNNAISNMIGSSATPAETAEKGGEQATHTTEAPAGPSQTAGAPTPQADSNGAAGGQANLGPTGLF